MNLSDSQRSFLESNQSAAMITIGDDGAPRAVRVGVALVDGKLWSSGTQDRVRTARLRRDPRCTLFVFDARWGWLTLDTTVRILEGADAPKMNLRLFQQMQNRPTGNLNWFGRELSLEEFLHVMVEENRLIYEFEVIRGYGLM
ncbi:MAG: pyridoxamine 5'-phosphate oxidase family protein [Anaerolineae bacterium]|uniref:pyridoxamine 5'-phosphate oxidase family protein n=1 Tax=Candidatus Amarolinea dominans TaxID=3140696 RepID=UPI001D3F1F7F|nr:pyridoxamine 5'-phosphate oxidase family protein [Anaerolineae bacterium]MBK9091577.1 pyridoxamine 5'-phosphate oxidase family protein [Anaerolineae bacterium]